MLTCVCVFWTIRQLVEKSLEHWSELCICFIDLPKAYDSVNREALMVVLWKYGVPGDMVRLSEEMNMVPGEDGGRRSVWAVWGEDRRATRMCLIPYSFNRYIDNILREVAESMRPGGGSASIPTKGCTYQLGHSGKVNNSTGCTVCRWSGTRHTHTFKPGSHT